jgi:hypothetical protein
LWVIVAATHQGSVATPESAASIHNQVLALHDVMLVVAAIVATTLGITLWAYLVKQRKSIPTH